MGSWEEGKKEMRVKIEEKTEKADPSMCKYPKNNHTLIGRWRNWRIKSSDVKFHEIFWREIFQEIFREIFLKYLKKFHDGLCMGAGSIVHCNKVSKPLKGKYLLLCMNSITYFQLTSYGPL